MPSTVRAKFFVRAKEQTKWNAGTEILTTVKLAAVVDSAKENLEFFKYTPTGTIDLGLLNKSTADTFEIGAEYYIDFIKVE